eukprot:1605610-Prymnesium_polylepis.1
MAGLRVVEMTELRVVAAPAHIRSTLRRGCGGRGSAGGEDSPQHAGQWLRMLAMAASLYPYCVYVTVQSISFQLLHGEPKMSKKLEVSASISQVIGGLGGGRGGRGGRSGRGPCGGDEGEGGCAGGSDGNGGSRGDGRGGGVCGGGGGDGAIRQHTGQCSRTSSKCSA